MDIKLGRFSCSSKNSENLEVRQKLNKKDVFKNKKNSLKKSVQFQNGIKNFNNY